MEALKIKGTMDLPNVILDPDNDYFEISGRSCPENVAKFYQQIFDWLNEYMENPNSKTMFNFKLTYYNTASAKLILNILQKLENMHENGQNVTVRWHYPEDDDDLEEAGIDYADIVNVPFEQISYSVD